MKAVVFMATACTKSHHHHHQSLGGESGGHKHEVDEGRTLCWKFATARDVVYYFIGERLKLEGETENRGV